MISNKDYQKLAAHYLLTAKKENRWPLDPVAHFHLGNGASIHAVHMNADTSDKGKEQSNGVMVNYLYDLRHISSNHEGFVSRQEITASTRVESLSKSANN